MEEDRSACVMIGDVTSKSAMHACREMGQVSVST